MILLDRLGQGEGELSCLFPGDHQRMGSVEGIQ